MFDPYSVLGVSRSATQEDIRSVWKQLQKTEHPDKMRRGQVVNVDASQRAYNRLKRAYGILGSPQRRVVYDKFGLAGLAKEHEGALISLEEAAVGPAVLLQFVEQMQRMSHTYQYQSRVQPSSEVTIRLDSFSPLELPSVAEVEGVTAFSRRVTESTSVSLAGGVRYTRDPWSSPCVPMACFGVKTQLPRLEGSSKTTLELLLKGDPTGRKEVTGIVNHRINPTARVSGNFSVLNLGPAAVSETPDSCTVGVRMTKRPSRNLTLFSSLHTRLGGPPGLPVLTAGLEYRDRMLPPRRQWSLSASLHYRPLATRLPLFDVAAFYPFKHFHARADVSVSPEAASGVTKAWLTLGKALSYYDEAGVTLQADHDGVGFALVYRYFSHTVRFPFQISSQASLNSLVASAACLGVAVFCGKLLSVVLPKLADYTPVDGVAVPNARQGGAADEESIRQGVRAAAEEARQHILNWTPMALDSAEQQLLSGGLSIIEAYYGDKACFPSSENPSPQASGDLAEQRFLDVRIQLQYRIYGIRSNNQELKLLVPQTSKAAQTGWYDPCPDLLKKTLRIQYLFRGELCTVDIDEFESALIPNPAHRICNP